MFEGGWVGRWIAGVLLSLLLAACGGGSGEGGATPGATPAAAEGARKTAQAAPAVADFRANGWYWNPAESGTGFMFEAQGTRGFVAFFMYEEGTGKPLWYASEGGAGSFVAREDGSFEYSGELRYYTNGQPAWSGAYVSPSSTLVGPVTMRFVGNDVTVAFPGGRTQRATRFDFNGLGGAPKANQPETGWYWNPAEGGRGWAVEVQNDRVFMAMFHYNPDGTPTWNVLEGDMAGGTVRDTFALYGGGQTLTSTYRPGYSGTRYEAGTYAMSFRNPCAGQVQLAGSPAVGIRRFVFGGLPAGEECRALAAQAGDVVPGVEAGPVRMQPGDAMHGRIETAGDVDAYGIALQAGVTYRFELKGASSGVGTLVDPYLALYSPTLQSLRENNNAASGTRDAALSFTAPTTDTYYLAARANGTGTGSFVLSASGVASDLVAQPVRPASDFSGTLNLALTGQQSGSLQLNIGASGNITGSLQWAGGTPLAVYGLLQAGGVFSVNAGGANFAGYVGTDGRAFGVWRTVGGTPQGGLVQGAGAVTLPASTLTVRARGSLNAGVGPTMVLRVDGAVVGSVVVQSTEPADYRFEVPRLVAGSRVDLVFTNDAWAEGQDRNLYISYVTDGRVTVLPTQPGAQVDWGSGERAWDGLDVIAGQGDLYSSGALRLTWPGAPAADPQAAQRRQAARLLMQASFGPSPQDIAEVLSRGEAGWIADQMARPPTPDFVGYVQGQWNQGDAFRPGGSSYDAMATVRAFWNAVATGPDPLRKRVAWSLHQIFVVSQADSNLYGQVRAYAGYLDILNRHAFGSYRQLLEDIALSPAMGIYLSHMRNRKEDPATGRVPDENFAREVMQLFSIGLVELNPDGTPKRGANGQPIETYGNADVMAMAKVFTGWSWGFPDNQLTDSNFRWGWPKYGAAEDQQIDLQPMKPYPNFHSGSEKVLFAGKPWAVTIPAGTPARESLRIALDTLANHPNVGPFLGRQLIQRLVTSNPSPAYVERVAAAFANNGQGVRGDLGAVVRAVLLDPEARPATPGPGFGKLREPVLRVAHWMRAFGARSTSGTYAMVWDLEDVNQRPFHPPSVFSYFRPGYVPPNTALAEADATAPEFQLLNETTAPQWVNLAEGMAGGGLGWSAGGRDVVPDLAGLQALVAAGDIDGLIALLDERLFAGRMSAALRQDILDALAGVGGSSADSQLNRVRVAVFVALASPEFLVQR